jgi:hypothetical protein
MRRRLPSLMLAVYMGCALHTHGDGEKGAAFCLVRDGTAQAVVVLPEKTELDAYLNPTEDEVVRVMKSRLPPGDSRTADEFKALLLKRRQDEAKRVGDEEKLAVDELTNWVERISGARLEVVRTTGDALPDGPAILVGSALARKAGFAKELDQLEPDGILLKVKGSHLVLAGRRARGTLYAVYDLLESLGCRWVMPGPFGDIYPSTRTLETSISKAENPTHSQRYWWCTHGQGSDYARWTLRNKGNFMTALDDQRIAQGHALGGPLAAGAKTDRAVMVKRSVKERKKGADGKPAVDEQGNPVFETVEREVPELPEEYYALHNGVARHGTPNMSNPKVWDLYAEHYIGFFGKSLFEDYVSISAEDGLVLDDRPETRKLDSGDYDWTLGKDSATDRLWFFHNRFIEKVTRVYPKRKFGVLVYSNNMMPPRLQTVHPNMALVFAPLTICPLHHVRDPKCKTNRAYHGWFEAWMAQARAAGAETYYYDYLPIGFQWNQMMISPQWALIGRNYPYFQEQGLNGHTSQGFDTWGSSAFNNWLAIRLYWNARQDYRAILAEYCATRFGAAAPAVMEYLEILEKRMDEVPDLYSNEIWGNHLVLTPEVRKACREALKKAQALADTERAKAQLKAVVDMQDSTDAFCDGIEVARETGDFAAAAARIEPAFAVRDRLNTLYSHFVHPTISSKDRKVQYEPGGWYNKYLTWDRRIKGAAASVVLPRMCKIALDTDNTAAARGWHKPGADVAALEDGDTTVAPDIKYQTDREVAAFFYRTEVAVPKSFEGRQKVILYFPSLIARAVQIWVNGTPVSFDQGTYKDTTWHGPDYFWFNYDHQASFDVSGLVKPGERNTLAFRVFKSYDHGGSYDRIFLLAHPKE